MFEKKIQLASVDELLGLGQTESSMEIEISLIRSFKDHPFRVVDDDKMKELVESIKGNGVLMPVVVRGNDADGYEMISGHRRLHASQLAGLTKVPAFVRDMTDDEATIVMVDSNIQREELLPSEKSFALRMKMEAMNRQGKRSDLISETCTKIGNKTDEETCFQNETKLNPMLRKSAHIIGEEIGISRNQVYRYIRLTYLIPSLLDLVDEKRLQFTCAVDISYFDKNIQTWLKEYIRENALIKPNQIAALREHVDKENIDQKTMISILNESLPGRVPAKKVVMNEKKLKKYFPKEYTSAQMEQVIEHLLEQWSNELKGTNYGV